ncbi:sphingomyelin phosphodiesterase 3 [Erinaceus europaeus]|uniref:Sphingomyelin phosphodiesterase 3 n=1 Tax=Erinaceus europaeus TaxID=9365 RepID=A0A1S2ZDK5_ERIEU|nr:sphingomyelin phosphodiesterase 3 [Erinaceus europaeus]XP_060041248.1 sphingomyelin phosphodiesterase 3 [Erinaceus europaeus]XP_060041249.1 sphingomyelin phosphodiesterase 3 [Erinaceus europaeus]XP_060041250.1 sphingomyelin phosphodiesterase 3 [Erinaceus europaeus]XP_060041251.1 sphingomyelin phosphodiesterase 3 [Erinaceus europaeus]XP_060041252.1 sphingomyelin phosphodiesterase 3 [Erinaceus europaeus]XP_060041253.1 sphingomyelin phosphodiesterase 3 [Erinaceus europaeus]XP_060041254.1 sph
MVLYTAPFPNSCLSALHAVSWALIFPCYWLLDRLVASFTPTTYEKRQQADDPCYLQLLCTVLFTPVYLALLVASLPFAFLGFLFWSPLQSVRRPYIYSCLEDKGPADGAALLSEWKGTGPGKSFCFASANLCLLPDSLARQNNVFNTQARAKEIGQRIRNGASRPQIKIYIDSPTNTSISAASFSSLVSPQGGDGVARAITGSIKRTASVEYKGDGGRHPSEEAANGPASGDPVDSGSGLEDACIVNISGEEGGQPSEADDTPTGNQARNGASGGSRGQTPNHSQQDGDSGSLGSPSASRESLVKARAGGDSGGSGEPSTTNSKLPYKASVVKKAAARKRRHPDEAFDHEISAFFPANLDFLCLQEVFDKRAAAKLKDQLHGYFEYILYDVGVYGCRGCCNFKFLNSGLFFASRYPIMDVAYHCYTNGSGADGLASKGVLFLKVQVGCTPQDQRIVGYISCTHLHAPPEDSAIRCQQLDMLQDWLADFRKSTSSSSAANPEELVAFDVICGDLNFDNCSSDDKLEQQHSLFTRYKDPCRLGPGEEKSWAIGTLLDTDGLYDEDVATPDNLQKILESEEGRREYLAYPTSKSSGGGQKGRKDLLKGNGRRIDYLLHAEEGLAPDWKAEVEEFIFVTQLSGLTDHLPVAMRLMVSSGEEEA